MCRSRVLTAESLYGLLGDIAGCTFPEGDRRVNDMAACVEEARGRFEIERFRSGREERAGQRGQLDDAGGFKHGHNV